MEWIKEVTPTQKSRIRELLRSLNGHKGFKEQDFGFEPTTPKDEYTGWNLHLRSSPDQRFYFKTRGSTGKVIYFPNPNNMEGYPGEFKERGIEAAVEKVRTFAKTWLDTIIENKRLEEELFALYASGDSLINDSEELTSDEIKKVRLFLKIYDDSIQSDNTISNQVKEIFTATKVEAEKKLENKPNRGFIKWWRDYLLKRFADFMLSQETLAILTTYYHSAINSAEPYWKGIVTMYKLWSGEEVQSDD